MNEWPVAVVGHEHAAVLGRADLAADRRLDALRSQCRHEAVSALRDNRRQQGPLRDRRVGIDPDVVADSSDLGPDRDRPSVDP